MIKGNSPPSLKCNKMSKLQDQTGGQIDHRTHPRSLNFCQIVHFLPPYIIPYNIFKKIMHDKNKLN